MQSKSLSAESALVKSDVSASSCENLQLVEVLAASSLGVSPGPISTPRSNRGVVKFSCSVDWLSVSFPGVSLLQWQEIRKSLQWLSLETKEATFGHGYECVTCAGYGAIGAREKDDGKLDGIVNLSGESLRHLAASGFDNLKVLQRLRAVVGGRLTRVDLAIDIFSSRVSVGAWWKKIEAREYASRARGVPRAMCEPSWAGGYQTMYVGSKSSPRMLRIYDKTQEQNSKSKAPPPADWTRIELQCRKEAAQAAGAVVASSGLQSIRPLVGGFFRFLDDAEWEQVIDGALSLSLPGRPASTPDKKLKWVTSKASGIAKILHYIGLCGLDSHVQAAMDETKETDGDISRWVNAFKAAS